jgi:hypothetical protein
MIEHKLAGQMRAIRSTVANNVASHRNTHYQIGESINSVLALCDKNVSDPDARMILETLSPIEIDKKAPFTVLSDQALVLCDSVISLLESLRPAPLASGDRGEQIARHGTERVVPKGRNVFLIHGHDYNNTARLRDILRDRLKLNPVILSDEPEKGRTVIEKFEQEARQCGYAFAIMTPDDTVVTAGGRMGQSRPNVIFEIGWFYGRLGRSRVCILFKKGTSIHSDLNGILRLEFSETVSEKISEIERELVEADIL